LEIRSVVTRCAEQRPDKTAPALDNYDVRRRRAIVKSTFRDGMAIAGVGSQRIERDGRL